MTGRARIAVAVIAVVVAAGGWWAIGGAALETSFVSPDGRHRVDLYRARRWQHLAYLPWKQEPGFARMVRTADDRTLATSRVIDLSESPVFWLRDGALVSTQVRYRDATNRWE